MAISIDEMRMLLTSRELEAVEEAIAAAVRSVVNREHLDLTARAREVGLTPLTADCILQKLRDDAGLIVRFGVALIRNTRLDLLGEFPEGEEQGEEDDVRIIEHLGYGTGFGITYVLYLYLLRECESQELLRFIKRRRMAHAESFARDLKSILRSVTD